MMISIDSPRQHLYFMLSIYGITKKIRKVEFFDQFFCWFAGVCMLV